MNAMSVPYQNDRDILAHNYPQYHRKCHFKQIARRNRKGHLLRFLSLKGITELAPAQVTEDTYALKGLLTEEITGK